MSDLDNYVCKDVASYQVYLWRMDRAFLFDGKGKRSVNDRVIHSIVNDFIHLRVMTAAQFIKWIIYRLGSNDHQRIRQIIIEMLRHHLIVATEVTLPVPQDSRIRSGGSTHNALVITLDRGSRKIVSDHPDFQFARFGPPEGIHLERLFHDTLIVQSYLHLSEEYDVVDIRCEDFLKSQIISNRKNVVKSDEIINESVPDFQLFLHKLSENGETIFFDSIKCEITVQSDKAQIETKAKDSVFFTADQRTADLVEATVNFPAIVLDDPANPLEYEKFFRFLYDKTSQPNDEIWKERAASVIKKTKKSGGTSLLQKHILTVIDAYGSLNAGAIGVLSNKKRDKISRELKPLTEKEVLHCAGIQANPGTQMGRPNSLFAFADTPLSDYNFRLKQLILSLSIEYLAAKGYRIDSYLPTENILSASKIKESLLVKLRLLIDEPVFSAKDFAEIFVGFETSGNRPNNIYFVPHSLERLKDVRNIRPSLKAIDIFK